MRLRANRADFARRSPPTGARQQPSRYRDRWLRSRLPTPLGVALVSKGVAIAQGATCATPTVPATVVVATRDYSPISWSSFRHPACLSYPSAMTSNRLKVAGRFSSLVPAAGRGIQNLSSAERRARSPRRAMQEATRLTGDGAEAAAAAAAVKPGGLSAPQQAAQEAEAAAKEVDALSVAMGESPNAITPALPDSASTAEPRTACSTTALDPSTLGSSVPSSSHQGAAPVQPLPKASQEEPAAVEAKQSLMAWLDAVANDQTDQRLKHKHDNNKLSKFSKGVRRGQELHVFYLGRFTCYFAGTEKDKLIRYEHRQQGQRKTLSIQMLARMRQEMP